MSVDRVWKQEEREAALQEINKRMTATLRSDYFNLGIDLQCELTAAEEQIRVAVYLLSDDSDFMTCNEWEESKDEFIKRNAIPETRTK